MIKMCIVKLCCQGGDIRLKGVDSYGLGHGCKELCHELQQAYQVVVATKVGIGLYITDVGRLSRAHRAHW